MEQRITFRPHPKQAQAYQSRSLVTMCCSGIQGGKSAIGALSLRHAIKKEWPARKYPKVSFVVAAPDYKILKQSTMQTFMRYFEKMGEYQDQDKVFTLADGRKVFFRTMIKNPNAIEGIPDCVFVWGDECGMFPRLAYYNIIGRVARMKGRFIGTTTPYAMNWVKFDVYDRWKEGDPDINFFEWLSIDNPTFPKEEYERQKKLLPERVFRRKYLGIMEQMEGLVYEFSEDRNTIAAFDTTGMDHYGGIDWGSDHPTAIAIRAIREGQAYTVSIYKRSGLTVSQVLDVIEAKHKLFKVKMFYCDPSRPEMIGELNKRGVPATGFHVGMEDMKEIVPGCHLHAEYLRSGQYKVFKGIEGYKDLKDEYVTYHWEKKEGEDYGKIERPFKGNDDLMDVERMLSVGTSHLMQKQKKTYKMPIAYNKKIDTWVPGEEDNNRGYEDY